MKRAVGILVLATLLGGAVWLGLASKSPSQTRIAADDGKFSATPAPQMTWPPGPFAHNCLPENADGDGDFDGDGLRDRVNFRPGYSSHGFVGWSLLQRFGDNHTLSKPVDAECPEVIGAVDIDGDGNDELFYDTGRGMTAALVDLLKLRRGKLQNVIHEPTGFSLYVGTSNAGSSDIECFRNERTGGLVVREKGGGAGRITIYVLGGPRLVRARSFGGASDPRGELDCFGLQWQGY